MKDCDIKPGDYVEILDSEKYTSIKKGDVLKVHSLYGGLISVLNSVGLSLNLNKTSLKRVEILEKKKEEYTMNPIPSYLTTTMLEVVKDIVPSKIDINGSLITTIPAGSKTWVETDYIENDLEYYLIENNRFCANIPKDYFRILQEQKPHEVKSASKDRCQPFEIGEQVVYSLDGLVYNVIGYANNCKVYITNETCTTVTYPGWQLNDEYGEKINDDFLIRPPGIWVEPNRLRRENSIKEVKNKIPKADGWVKITKSARNWSSHMDQFVGLILQIDSTIKTTAGDTRVFFKNPPPLISNFAWIFEDGHFVLVDKPDTTVPKSGNVLLGATGGSSIATYNPVTFEPVIPKEEPVRVKDVVSIDIHITKRKKPSRS